MLSYQIREYFEFLSKELILLEESMNVLFEYEKKYQQISSSALSQIFFFQPTQTSTHGKYSYILSDGNIVKNFVDSNSGLINKFDLLQSFGKFTNFKTNVTTYEKTNDIDDSYTADLIEI